MFLHNGNNQSVSESSQKMANLTNPPKIKGTSNKTVSQPRANNCNKPVRNGDWAVYGGTSVEPWELGFQVEPSPQQRNRGRKKYGLGFSAEAEPPRIGSF